MKLKYICTLALSLALASCIKDKSTDAINHVSKIEIQTPLEQVYTSERWQELVIAPPKLKDNAGGKPLEYQWQINYKTVSTEPTLRYVCDTYGLQKGRLRISNGDEIVYVDFQVDVRLPYGSGLYVLAEEAGKVILSYDPLEAKDRKFTLDVLASNNPKGDFSGTAVSAYYRNVALNVRTPMMVLAQSNPNRLYTIYADSMQVARITELSASPEALQHRGNKTTNMILGEGLASIDIDSYFVTNTLWRSKLTELGEGSKLSGDMTPWRKENSAYYHGVALWDKTKSRLVGINGDEYVRIPSTLLTEGTFTGATLIKMLPADNSRKLALFLKKSDGGIEHALVQPGVYRYNSTETAASVEHKSTMQTSSGIKETSVFVVAPKSDIVYYSSDAGAIYGYNLKSSGNYPTSATLTLPAGSGDIADMLISPDERYLYVGTNATSGAMRGSLYCYEIASKQLVWTKKNVTGTIKQLVYRPE